MLVCLFNLVDFLHFYKCSSTVYKEYNRESNLSKLCLCTIYQVGSEYPDPWDVAPYYPDPVGKNTSRTPLRGIKPISSFESSKSHVGLRQCRG